MQCIHSLPPHLPPHTHTSCMPSTMRSLVTAARQIEDSTPVNLLCFWLFALVREQKEHSKSNNRIRFYLSTFPVQ